MKFKDLFDGTWFQFKNDKRHYVKETNGRYRCFENNSIYMVSGKDFDDLQEREIECLCSVEWNTMPLNLVACEIDWDTDGEDDSDLPVEIEIPKTIIAESRGDADELTDLVSDYISDQTGFCHNGFSISD